MSNLKQIGGGHCKTLVDLTWNDRFSIVQVMFHQIGSRTPWRDSDTYVGFCERV